jgi:hypothetical protein
MMSDRTCYIDGMPCDCTFHDVLNDGCPRDEYVHEEDQDYSDCVDEPELEAFIDREYYAQNHGAHDDETRRF